MDVHLTYLYADHRNLFSTMCTTYFIWCIAIHKYSFDAIHGVQYLQKTLFGMYHVGIEKLKSSHAPEIMAMGPGQSIQNPAGTLRLVKRIKVSIGLVQRKKFHHKIWSQSSEENMVTSSSYHGSRLDCTSQRGRWMYV
eukprot:jgi/Picsp_1/6630/NSC_03973-R1_---NA---